MGKRIILAALMAVTLLFLCGFDANGQKVFDNAGLLTPEEVEELQDQAAALGTKLQLDVVIVTTNDTEGKSSVAYADDFFDYQGFGYEKEMGSGILYLIDMDNRKSTISTSGSAIDRYSDEEQANWQEELTASLKDADYYGACSYFLEGVQRYEAYSSIQPVEAFSAKNLLIRLAISLVCAAIVVGVMAYSTQKLSGAGGRCYQKGSINVKRQVDQFTHTTVVKRKIETNNNSGGHSSSHTGSSGNSHGGSSSGF